MDLETAIKKCVTACYAAIFQAILTAGIVLVAINSEDPTGNLAFFTDPWLFADVVILLGFAAGLYAKSRTIAILSVCYTVFSVLAKLVGTGSPGGLAGGIVFGYLYLQAVFGSFAYVRITRETNPDFRKRSVVLLVLAAVGALAFTGLMGLGLVSELGQASSTKVETGDTLSEDQIAWFRENGILEEDEEVEYFYSAALLSYKKDGNMLTNKTVTSYADVSGGLQITDVSEGLQIYYAYFNQITAIVLEQESSLLSDALVRVDYTVEEEDSWLYLYLSGEAGGDIKFLDKLEERTGLKVQKVAAE